MIRRTILFLLFVAAAPAARAQGPTPTPPDAPKAAPAAAKPDSEGFVPVRADEPLAASESLPASGLVGAAYGFILAALVIWVASVAARGRKVEEELTALRARIEKKG